MEELWANAIDAVRRCDLAAMQHIANRHSTKLPLWPVQLELERALWLTDENLTTAKFPARREIRALLRAPSGAALPEPIGGYWRDDGTCRWTDDELQLFHRTAFAPYIAAATSKRPDGAPLSVYKDILTRANRLELGVRLNPVVREFVDRRLINGHSNSEWYGIFHECIAQREFLIALIAIGEVALVELALSMHLHLPGTYEKLCHAALRHNHLDLAEKFIRDCPDFARADLRVWLNARRWLAANHVELAAGRITPPELLCEWIAFIIPRALAHSEYVLKICYSTYGSKISRIDLKLFDGQLRTLIWRELDAHFAAARVNFPNTRPRDMIWDSMAVTPISLATQRHVTAWLVARQHFWCPEGSDGLSFTESNDFVANRATYLFHFWYWWTMLHPSHWLVWFFAIVLVSDEYYTPVLLATQSTPLARFIRIGTRLPQELQQVLAEHTGSNPHLFAGPILTREDVLRWLMSLLSDPFFALSD